LPCVYNYAFPSDCFVLDPFLLAHKANIELSRRCSFGRDKTGTFTRREINIACVIKDSSVFQLFLAWWITCRRSGITPWKITLVHCVIPYRSLNFRGADYVILIRWYELFRYTRSIYAGLESSKLFTTDWRKSFLFAELLTNVSDM